MSMPHLSNNRTGSGSIEPSSASHRRQRSRYNSGQRADVLVHVKEVVGVVFRLEFLEASVIGTVRSGNRIAQIIVVEIVHVAGGGDKGRHIRKSLPRPGDASIGNRRFRPLGDYKKIIAVGAQREGC